MSNLIFPQKVENVRSGLTLLTSSQLFVDSLTDSELLDLIESKDYEEDGVGARGPYGETTTTIRITSDAVAKPEFSSVCEGFVMNYVAENSDIPVPKLRRRIKDGNRTMIVIDYVDSETLEFAWPKASLWQKIRIVLTLRSYIEKLRKIPIPNKNRPGPFDSTDQPHTCFGSCFPEVGAGPFPSYKSLSDYMNEKLRLTLLCEKLDGTKGQAGDSTLRFNDSTPLVITHGDLSLQNIMMDKGGKIWLIDWGCSGAYPEWFEYFCMKRYEDPRTPWFWRNIAVPIITGRYAKSARFIDRISYALINYGMTE